MRATISFIVHKLVSFIPSYKDLNLFFAKTFISYTERIQEMHVLIRLFDFISFFLCLDLRSH